MQNTSTSEVLSPRLGMFSDLHPSSLKDGQYTYALNAAIESTTGEGIPTIQNESSTLLCAKLPQDHHILAHKYLSELNSVLVFTVHNMATHIGIIKDCIYTKLLETECFKFHRGSAVQLETKIKKEYLYVYFVDGKNPRRYVAFNINTWKVKEDLLQKVVDGCNITYKSDIDCIATLVEKVYTKPTITVKGVVAGGKLLEGNYQFIIDYATENGTPITEYEPATNPIPIFEHTLLKTIKEPTDKAIQLQIDADDIFGYYNLVVAETINNFTSFHLVGTFSTALRQVTYTGTKLRDLTEEEIFFKYPSYDTASGVTKSNDYLFWTGLKERKVSSYQAAANKIKAYWFAIKVDEDFYKDPKNCELYKTYHRDEVVALNVVYVFDDGRDSASFHIPGREAIPTDREIVESIPDDCGTMINTQKWQRYNTANTLFKSNTIFDDCKPIEETVYQWGEFGYWESTDTYEFNKEYWDDLCGKPIRHHKFPDSSILHIHDGESIPSSSGAAQPSKGYDKRNFIFPMGIKVDADSIKLGLNYAVSKGFLSAEEKNRVVGYKITRLNRAGNETIIAKGLFYDAWEYTNMENRVIYFPNFPYNELGYNKLLLTGQRTLRSRTGATSLEYTKNPNYTENTLLYKGTGRYTFHSPNTHFSEPTLGNIVKLETEEAGISKGYFIKYNENYPKYKIVCKNDFRGDTGHRQYFTQYNSIGNYNSFVRVEQAKSVFNVEKTAYMKGDVYNINENQSSITFHNFLRESSVYVKVNKQFPKQKVVDNSRIRRSDVGCPEPSRMAPDHTRSKDYFRQISSYYGSIKRYIANQYGTIGSGEVIDTTNQVTSLNKNAFVFGGDIFITKFALKRKHHFFLQTVYDKPDETDFFGTDFFNGVPPWSVLTTNMEKTKQVNGLALADCGECRDGNQQELEGFVYNYYYGIPYFFVESEVNTHFRHAENTSDGTFYPFESDLDKLLNEKFVNPTADNNYTYDVSYSKQNKEHAYTTIKPQAYRNKETVLNPNLIIYSEQDSLFSGDDAWLLYKANNIYEFPFINGKLISVAGIEADKILCRFENNLAIFNAYSTLEAGPEQIQISNGGMFRAKPQEFTRTDLGYIGTQHRTMINTEFGHIVVDSQRGQVFNIKPNVGGIDELSKDGIRHWLRENLPFKIKEYFPEVDIDNAAQNVGITMGYERKLNRLLLTKLDYIPKSREIKYNPISRDFYILQGGMEIRVDVNDPQYFRNVSWTLSYNFITNTWISYHSYRPTYYISTVDYLLSGKQGELWRHGSNGSYQTFYGKTYPFSIELTTKYTGQTSVLHAVEYQAETKSYRDGQYRHNDMLPFTTGVVYNDKQTTGLLEFKKQNKADPKDGLFTIATNDKTLCSVSNSENTWRFNMFSDVKINDDPMWIDDSPYRRINNLCYISNRGGFDKPRIRSDVNYIYLSNDTNTESKILMKLLLTNSIKSFR